MDNKKNVLLLFGGVSGEYDITLKSVTSIFNSINKDTYNVSLAGITREGEWIYCGQDIDSVTNDTWVNVHGNSTYNIDINLVPQKNKKVGIYFNDKNEFANIDVIIPVLHGPYGEDGKIQGLLEISQIPYVGCGVLASSVGMDKLICKKVFSQAGIPQVDYTYTTRMDFEINPESELDRIESTIKYPIFVKPANMGSSVGISKVKNREELYNGILEALKYDVRIVLEEGRNVREIEVAVIGNETVKASIAGEIIPAKEFYDFNDKYVDGASICQIPAKISEEQMELIRTDAVKAFKAIDGKGLSRVDFFIDKDSNEIFINEINTFPGFTNISMYPKMWEVSGLDYSSLIDKLIELAENRYF